MATIIIPAHNESTVIGDCLDSIVRQEGVSHVIVACNGCTDETADLVRSDFPSVHCLDIAKPSKVNALNEADQKARELGMEYPVFYLDADTVLGDRAIGMVSEALSRGEMLLAAPTPQIDTSNSSWCVKQFYKTWLSLPYVREGVIATCSYVLSKEGRARFETFPEIIADDGYVRHHFSSEEIGNVPNATITIRAPKDLYSLLKIKTRSRLGFMELKAKGLVRIESEKPYGKILLSRLLSRDFLSTLIYSILVVVIRIRAKRQFRKLDTYTWEKDLTSRKS